MVDPAAFGVGDERFTISLPVRRHDLPVIAAGHHPPSIRRGFENGPAMHGDAFCFSRGGSEQQRLLAKHKDRRVTEEMRRYHRSAGVDGAQAVSDGGRIGRSHHLRVIARLDRAIQFSLKSVVTAEFANFVTGYWMPRGMTR
jgi:hypothetical protein